jgi:hypothetical protein
MVRTTLYAFWPTPVSQEEYADVKLVVPKFLLPDIIAMCPAFARTPATEDANSAKPTFAAKGVLSI